MLAAHQLGCVSEVCYVARDRRALVGVLDRQADVLWNRQVQVLALAVVDLLVPVRVKISCKFVLNLSNIEIF